MDKKVDSIKKFNCKICNKIYASYKSIWNHNKKFHNLFVTNNQSNVTEKTLFVTEKTLFVTEKTLFVTEKIPKINNTINCSFCEKKFNFRQNKYQHEKICKLKKNNKIEQLENSINELKDQVSILLKEKKTSQKIKSQLNNNGNINNIKQQINNTYVKFGDLDYQKILNNNQIKQILNKQFMALEESIKQIHFNNNFPEYNNVFITNMKDDIAYIFNGKQFISIRKNEMLNDLIDTHVNELNLSLEKNKNKLNNKYVTKLEKFLDMLNDDDTKFTDQDNQRIYPSYKVYKMNTIKLLIYNESDKKKLELLNKINLKEKIDDYENITDTC